MTCSEKKENWSAIGLWVGCPQSFSSPSCSSFQGILHRSSSGSESIWYVPGARDQHLGVTDLEDSRFNPLAGELWQSIRSCCQLQLVSSNKEKEEKWTGPFGGSGARGAGQGQTKSAGKKHLCCLLEGGLIRPLNFILFFVFSSPSMTAANMQRKILGGNQRKKKERM